ncbi:MAG: hypothetical protein ACRCX4_03305 [Bacteroidales bacterium]
MEIISIFDPNLYAVAYDKHEIYASIEDLSHYINEDDLFDELTKAIELWTNPEYLESFFQKNNNFLQSGYWGNITIQEAISKTIEWAKALEEFINKSDKDTIENCFLPLNNQTPILKSLGKSKLKENWLRLYAIKIDTNRFLITGGAIKLTRSMHESDHTRNELKKLSKVCEYLKGNDVFDGDSFDDLLFEISL